MLDWLLAAPAMVKVGVMFAAILVLNGCGLQLGLAIVACALGLSLWSGAGLAGLLHQAASFAAAENLLLLFAILCLLFFTEALGASGRIEATIAALRQRLRSPRLLLAGLPALIGLLPMPGGALVSAPMVASVDRDNRVDPVRKAAINYWFRHIWEYWWPLYPGVVLAMKYCGLSAATFYLVQMPLTLVAVLGGWWFIMRRVTIGPQAPAGAADGTAPRASAALVPIGLLVLCSLAGAPLGVRLGLSGTEANLVAMLAGMALALLLVFAARPQALRPAARMLRSAKTWQLMLVVVGVQAFAAALKCPLAGNATLVTQMSADCTSAGIPVVLVMAVIPFVAGMVTGLAMGFVGVSFPLVFGLLGDAPSLATLAATTTFAYAFGYAGMILSPIHICYVVTNEYFGTRVTAAYRYTVGPALLVLAASVVMAWAYGKLL